MLIANNLARGIYIRLWICKALGWIVYNLYWFDLLKFEVGKPLHWTCTLIDANLKSAHEQKVQGKNLGAFLMFS